MAIDFKTPEKFVFDHSTKKQSDKLRQLLGLVYGLGTEVDPIEILKGATVDPYIDFTQVIGDGDIPKFVVSRNQNKTEAENSLLKVIENHINQVNNPDEENNSQFFEDFNFKIDKNLLKNFSVQTIVRNLQENDIQEGNLDYPGGELNPKKKETSLKFAYAFETIKIQGEEQVVAKKVKLVNGADDLIKRANNENNNDLEIKELKNLFYFTPQDDQMNAEIIGEGSESDFDLDKIYNIIKIDLAAIKDPKETQNSIYNFSPVAGSPGINGLIDLENKTDLLIQKIDNSRFLKYATQLFINPNTPLDKYLPENSFNIFGYGLPVDIGNLFYQIYEKEISSPNPLTKQIADDYYALENYLSEIKVLTTLNNFNIYKDYNYDILFDAALSIPLKPYQLIDLIQKFKLAGKIPLSNYTEADLFRSAQKTNGKFVFNLGQRNDNLLRPAFPAGLRLVKSTQPYDPDNTNTFNNSILQTFYIPLGANPNENQIRLFDSQIIYGKTYYYTLFGIYYVDGKFYFYPHTKINKVKEKTGSVEIVVGENKQETDDKNNKVYKNPCCEYNYFSPTYFFDNFVKPENLSGDNIQKFKKDAQINQNLNNDQIFALDELSKIGLAWGKYITGGESFASPYDFQVGTYGEVDPQLRKAFECFLCREGSTIKQIRAWADNEQKVQKGFSYGAKDNQTNESPIILEGKLTINGTKGKYALIGRKPNIAALIDCTEFGWNTAFGAGISNPTLTEPSLESIGKEKDSKEIYLDGEYQTYGIVPRCKREDRTSIFTEKFKDFKFQLFESNARRTYEIPLLPSLENSVVSLIPLPPIVEFVPLADINNRIKIKFQESAASGFTKVQVDEAVKILNDGVTYEKIVNRSKEEAKENGLSLEQDAATLKLSELLARSEGDIKEIYSELLARSEGDIKEIYAFKLDRVPTSLQDLIDNGERFILDYKNGKTAYFSNVLPNEKYYYAFVSRDVTGLFSTATETFQVEIVEGSGYVYTKIDLYDYVTKEIKVTTKEFQKLLKIKPSFEEMLPNETEEGKQKLGTNNLYSQYNFGGKSDTQPPRFKIRIRSKKTNRVFDINLKYSQNIKEITSKKLIEQLKKVSELVDQKKVKKNN